MTSPQALAEAFSHHRFSDTYDHLSPDVRWVAVGGATTVGRTAVVEACELAGVELAALTLERRRFLTICGGDRVAVDTVTRYVDPSGEESNVASCDIYEFEHDLLSVITSYTVELEAD
jgi:hypothetical protein